MKTDQPFLTDVKQLREQARSSIDRGAVTPTYQGNVKQTIEILQSGVTRTMALLGVTCLEELSPRHVTQLRRLGPISPPV